MLNMVKFTSYLGPSQNRPTIRGHGNKTCTWRNEKEVDCAPRKLKLNSTSFIYNSGRSQPK